MRILNVALILLAASIARAQAPSKIAESAKERIGQMEFFDRSFSLEGTMRCATCHNPDIKFGFADGRKIMVGAIGTRAAPNGLIGVRNTMSLLNIGNLMDKDVWSDGRTKGLYAQCFSAVTDPLVLQMPSVQAAIDRMNAGGRYAQLAKVAYGSNLLSEPQARECMVVFLKGIRVTDMPADRLAAGLKANVPDSVVRGSHVFESNCTACHQPQNDWRDFKFHNIGIESRSAGSDQGRAGVTNNPADNFCFATPSLAGCNYTAPYMHNGSMETLEEVVGFFAHGGKFVRNNQIFRDPNIDPLVASIELNAQEESDLLSYVKIAFQGKYPERKDPFEEVARK